ncbi:hypothetical protein PR202_gb28333 [Eleusine coracana subsp. coracana]|uniref:Uncharacterized protein n=1 Tax=Eleusine coracana subsp. coracana TaxID=191504 RepID=A0AAV5FWI9_ELECO|nr:hypothetical protein PR202_gb28333 [Eleusine coracana subsp. coracana]
MSVVAAAAAVGPAGGGGVRPAAVRQRGPGRGRTWSTIRRPRNIIIITHDHGLFVLERVEEEEEEERSSIGAASDQEEGDEADSAAAGATTTTRRRNALARGLSNFFSGKSRSFASLQDAAVTTAQDLAKPEKPIQQAPPGAPMLLHPEGRIHPAHRAAAALPCTSRRRRKQRRRRRLQWLASSSSRIKIDPPRSSA